MLLRLNLFEIDVASKLLHKSAILFNRIRYEKCLFTIFMHILIDFSLF
jgi:hypothetical protein